MDSKSLLMQAGQIATAEPAPVLDYRDLQRSIVLLSSFRSGSHMLKLSLEKLTGLTATAEPFNHFADDPKSYTLKNYFAEGAPGPNIMTEGNKTVHHFLARFYKRVPGREAILLDVKYPQAYVFGVDMQMDVPLPIPTLLQELRKLDVPFIHLTRRDLVAQAISLLIAERTGTYFSVADEGLNKGSDRVITLAPKAVLSQALRIRNARDHARTVLSAIRCKVLEISYESLISANGREHYREIMRFIGQYADIPANFEPPTLRQDSQSQAANLADIRDFVSRQDPSLNG